MKVDLERLLLTPVSLRAELILLQEWLYCVRASHITLHLFGIEMSWYLLCKTDPCCPALAVTGLQFPVITEAGEWNGAGSNHSSHAFSLPASVCASVIVNGGRRFGLSLSGH